MEQQKGAVMAVYITLHRAWRIPDAVRSNGTQFNQAVLPGRYRMIEVPQSPFRYGNPGPYWLFDPAQPGFEETQTGYSKWFWEQWTHEGHGDGRVTIEIKAAEVIASAAPNETKVPQAA